MTRRLLPGLLLVSGLLAGLAGLAACDAGFDGDRPGNQPPRTTLAVRDTSLVENICTQTPQGPVCSDDDDLFTSTVFVAWSGTDPDGFVVGYELRFYDVSERPGPEDLWRHTTRRDTVVLLPLPPGQQTAQVVFEVRAIDNEGARDPNPARTVFPIRNSPPSIRLVAGELPPDTTWTVFSFAWEASDPEGPDDIAGIEVSFNDPENFVRLPATATFATFVIEGAQPGDPTGDARVHLGRGFTRTEFVVPGVNLNGDNTLYVRAVDRTEAASPTLAYPNPDLEQTWFVRQPKSQVLLINDFRSIRSPEVMTFHRSVLAGYLGGGAFDEWDLSKPDTGVAANTQYSSALPSSPSPTLRETLRIWRYVYWVSDGVTDGVRGNNLALAAPLFDGFLAAGGRLFVQVPFTAPLGGEIETNNPAFDLLPSESIVVLPNGVPPNLAIPAGGQVTPVQPVPGTGRQLPTLVAPRLSFSLPYTLNPTTATPLYSAQLIDRDGGNAPWTGPSFVASMDVDRRVALLALQLYTRNRFDFLGPGNDEMAPRLAVQYILEGLQFPGQPEG